MEGKRVICISIAQGRPLLIFWSIFFLSLPFNLLASRGFLESTLYPITWMEYKCQLCIHEKVGLGIHFFFLAVYTLEYLSLDLQTTESSFLTELNIHGP